MKTLQTFLFVAYFFLMTVVLGGTIFSVMVEYPNWFADLPHSLKATRDFYQVLHPGYFFQTFGPLCLLSGIGFVIAGWRITQTRNLVVAGIAVLVAMELLTFLYIYPRLGIMFGPDSAAQSVDVLRTAGSQFTTADRIRTALAFISSALSIVALFRFFRQKYAGN